MRLQLLGSISVLGQMGTVSLPRAQTRGLLALLALHPGQTLTHDAIVEAIWGGHAPSTARTQMHGAVSAIRRLLAGLDEPQALAGGRFGYQLLVRPEDVDVHCFELWLQRGRAVAGQNGVEAAQLLRKALELWRGEPLADATGAFIESARARLTEQRLGALELLASLDLTRGDNARVIAELAPVIELHPLREHLVAVFATALARAGRAPEALASLRSLRLRLAEQEGLDPGAEIADLEVAILRGSISGHSGPAKIDRNPGAINQLPAKSAGFTGREAELNQLDRVLQHRDQGLRPAAMACVSGPAGSGKTSLAVHWAHRVASTFPDGVLYADLHGGSGERVASAITVADAFLRALGVPAVDLPSGLDDLSARLRGELATRRVLLVLDNAGSMEQIQPLLPGVGDSAVVITSRRSADQLIQNYGVTSLELAELPLTDAVALLYRNGGPALRAAKEERVGALATLCGNLPLALRLAAARLNQAGLSLEMLITELSQERGKLALLGMEDLAITAGLNVTYMQLSPGGQHLLQVFGLHYGPSPHLDALAQAAGLSTAELATAVAELVTLGLVDQAGERLIAHDLIRWFAAERANLVLGPAKAAQVRERILAWLLALTYGADLMIRQRASRVDITGLDLSVPAFSSGANAISRLDEEAENLLSALSLAAPEHSSLVWRLAGALSGWLEQRVPLSTWIDVNSVAAEAAATEGDLLGEALLANGLGIAYGKQRSFDPAIAAFRRVRRLREHAGLTEGASAAMHNLGCAYRAAGRLDEAEATFKELLQRLEDQPSDFLVGHVKHNLSDLYAMSGRWTEALDAAVAALALAAESGDIRRLISIHICVAVAYRGLGQPQLALAELEKANKFLDDCTDRVLAGDVAATMGEVQLDLGQMELAVESLQQAVNNYESVHHARSAHIRSLLASLPNAA